MRTVLWDMDGTIADTEDLHLRAWQATVGEYDIAYDYERFLADFGRRNGEILSELLGVDGEAELVKEVADRKEATFRRLLNAGELQLLPGVREWLGRFQEAGVRQAVSSSGAMANIAAIVNKLEIGDFFLGLLSGAALPKGKPDPSLFLHSAAALGVAPRDCIVIEDSVHGIEAAQRANMASIAVGKIAHSAELRQLISVTNDPGCHVVDSLQGLLWRDCDNLWSMGGGSIFDSSNGL